MNYVIIGNGGAGVRAAETIRNRDREGKITIIDRESHRCYYRMMLPDYISGWKSRDSIYVVPEDFYEKNGIDFMSSIVVQEVNPDKRQVLLQDGKVLDYDRLLIASGARPRILNIPGIGSSGVVTLRTLDQAEEIIALGSQAKEGVVLGGGLLGVELARAFNEMGLKTRYLIRENRFWPQMLDKVGSSIVERKLEEKGIEILKEEVIEEIEENQGKVKGVITSQGRYLEAQLVGLAVGIVLNIEFLEGSGISTDSGILVNQRLESNLEGIYAAGDVAQAYDLVHGEHRVNTSWMNAQRQGTIAGINMSGGEEILEGSIPFNLINIYGIPVVCMGLDLPSGEGYEVLTGDYPRGNLYKKYVLKDDLLVGATLIGDIREARILEKMIINKASLGSHKNRLFEDDFDLEEAARELLG